MPCSHQRGRDVVLRRERVAGAEHDVGAAVLEGDGQVRRLGGDVEAGRQAQARPAASRGEALADQLEDRHLRAGPLHLEQAAIGQADVLNVVVFPLSGHLECSFLALPAASR